MEVKATRLVGEDMIPTKVSQLENDKKYQTEEQVNEKIESLEKQIPTELPASDVYSWAKQPNKPTYTKEEIGLGNVNNVAITKEEVAQIGTNKTNIENTNKQVETNIQHISNAQSTANEALNIAKGRAITKVFDTFGDMTNYLKSASKEEFKLGDNLLIKATNVPDYWISNILENNSGVYGYYEISILETQKVDLSNYYNKSEIDTKETNINNKIDTKANSIDVYNKNESDERYALKGESGGGSADVDLSNYYTKDETNSLVEKVDRGIITKTLGSAVPKTGYIEKIYVNTSLAFEEVITLYKSIRDESLMYSGHVIKYYIYHGKRDDLGNYSTLSFLRENDYFTLALERYEKYEGGSGSVRTENTIIFDTSVGWNPDFNGEIEVNSEVYDAWSSNSVYKGKVGSSNDLLSKLFSLDNNFTPSLKEELHTTNTLLNQKIDTSLNSLKDILTEVIKNIGNDTIRSVPKQGYIDKVYINTSLSVDEVNEILTSSNLKSFKGWNVADYYVAYTPSNKLTIEYWKDDDIYYIRYNGKTVFKNNYGFYSDYKDVQYLDIQDEVIGVPDEHSAVAPNEILTRLFSINGNFAPKNSIVEEISNKANSSDVYTKNETETLLENYKDKIGLYGLTPVFNRSDKKYIENVYINTSLSINEVISMIDTLDEKCWYGNVYYVFRTKTYTLNISKDYHIYAHIKTDSGSSRQAEIFNTTVGFKNIYFTNEVIEVNEQQSPYTSDPGTQNEKLVNLFSLAPFFEESTLVEKVYSLDKSLGNYYKKEETYSKNEIDYKLNSKVESSTFNEVLQGAEAQLVNMGKEIADIQNKIYMGEVEGITKVPNSGTLDTLYINTSLSNSEVNSLIDQVVTYYSGIGGSMYYAFLSSDNATGMFFLKADTTYQIMLNISGSLKPIYENGWKTSNLPSGYENGIALNVELVSSESSIGNVGDKNDKLINLIYVQGTTIIPINEEVKNNTKVISKIDSQLNSVVVEGLAIPNSGVVEKIALNTSLSAKEVIDIISLSNLNYIQLDVNEYIYMVAISSEIIETAPVFGVMINCIVDSEDSNKFESSIVVIYNGNTITIWQGGSDGNTYTGTFDPLEVGIPDIFELNMELTSEFQGMSVGTDNEKLKKLSYVPNTKGGKSFYEKANELYDYVGVPNQGGVVVPNSGTIEKIYFNTSLSAEEVVSIIENANLTYNTDLLGLPIYGILYNDDEVEDKAYGILLMVQDGVYAIVDYFNQTYYFFSQAVPDAPFDCVGWNPDFNGEIELTGTTINSLQGLNIGVENDKLLNLVSLTNEFGSGDKTTLTERVVNVENELNGYESESKPTIVPNSGYVEKLYVNTSLSVEEVVSVLSNLDFGENSTYYGLGVPSKIGLMFVSMDGLYGIANELTEEYYFVSADIGMGFVGWNTSFNGIIEVNTNVSNEMNGLSIGTQNDKLTSLFSTTPFGVMETHKGLIERVNELEKKCEDIAVPVHKFTDRTVYLDKKEDLEEGELLHYNEELEGYLINITEDTILNINNVKADSLIIICLNGNKLFINNVYDNVLGNDVRCNLDIYGYDMNNVEEIYTTIYDQNNLIDKYGVELNSYWSSFISFNIQCANFKGLVYHINECWILNACMFGIY